MIYIFLAFFWPFINYIRNNLYKIGIDHTLVVIVLILAILSVASAFIITKVLRKPMDRFLLPVFISILLFFIYSSIVEKIRTIWLYDLTSTKAALIYPYVYLGVSITLVYLSWVISAKKAFQTASKVFIVTVFATSCLSIAIKSYHHESNIQQLGSTTYYLRHKPNVYYILMDAYARQDTLNEIADYNNEPFLKQLEKYGFIISRNAKSNYHFTTASLSATMNLCYHPKSKNLLIAHSSMAPSLRGQNNVRNIFHQNGYHIINIPSHWNEGGCYGHEDTCIKEPSCEVYQSFLSKTPLKNIRFPVKYASLEFAKNIQNIEPNKPKFVFIHIAQVHDAVFDETGKFNPPPPPGFWSISNKHDAAIYASSVKMMNTKLLEFIDYIKTKDPKSIIIIQADHGPNYTGNGMPLDVESWIKNNNDFRLINPSYFRYKFGILSAIYLPKYNVNSYKKIKSYFSGPFTLVNTFRYIFAYLSDQEPKLLPEESFFLYHDGSGQFFKVIDNINNLTI